MTQRLFWRFKAHDSGTFVAWHDTTHLVYRSDDANGQEVRVMLQSQAGERIDKSAYVDGLPIRVQFGEASKWTSQMNGGTRWMTFPRHGGVTHRRVDALVGHHCVTAITHADPRVALLSLHAMLDQFGPGETLRHLGDFADGASSLQTEISLRRSRYERGASSFAIHKGLLCMHRRIGDDMWIDGRALHFSGQFPESVLLALPGRMLSSLLEHAATSDPSLTIERIQVNGERHVAWTDQVVGVRDAIALVERLTAPLAKAA